MSRTYEQLTAEQRYTIQQLKELNFSQTDIATAVGVHKSSICRELGRNTMQNGKYKSANAQQYTVFRHKNKRKHLRLTDVIKQQIGQLLQQGFSPEQTSHRLKLEGYDSVSTETIYLYIWQDKANGGTLYLLLPRKQRCRTKRGNKTDCRGQISNKTSIEQRPTEANKRERFGDFEQDTIIGSNHKGAILTMVDRKTLLTKLVLLEGKNAKQLSEQTIKTLKDFMPFLHTITSDNGKEFAMHQTITEQLGIKYYFTHPYSSYECGTVENTNGLIRRYIPKKTSFKNLTQERLNEIEYKLNNRPRKKLGFYTPNEVVNAIFTNDKPILNKIAFIT